MGGKGGVGLPVCTSGLTHWFVFRDGGGNVLWEVEMKNPRGVRYLSGTI